MSYSPARLNTTPANGVPSDRRNSTQRSYRGLESPRETTSTVRSAAAARTEASTLPGTGPRSISTCR